MNLTFPTPQMFPIYPTPPIEDDEAASMAFLEALRDFFQHLLTQHDSTQRYFDAARFYFSDSNQEGMLKTQAVEVTQQAIAAVIKNMTQPARTEYVWDSARNCWVLKRVPL